MEDSRDRCEFKLTERNVTIWRVAENGSLQKKDELLPRAADQEAPKRRDAKHGCLRLNEEKLQIKEEDQAAHLALYIHLCEARAAERSA